MITPDALEAVTRAAKKALTLFPGATTTEAVELVGRQLEMDAAGRSPTEVLAPTDAEIDRAIEIVARIRPILIRHQLAASAYERVKAAFDSMLEAARVLCQAFFPGVSEDEQGVIVDIAMRHPAVEKAIAGSPDAAALGSAFARLVAVRDEVTAILTAASVPHFEFWAVDTFRAMVEPIHVVSLVEHLYRKGIPIDDVNVVLSRGAVNGGMLGNTLAHVRAAADQGHLVRLTLPLMRRKGKGKNKEPVRERYAVLERGLSPWPFLLYLVGHEDAKTLGSHYDEEAPERKQRHVRKAVARIFAWLRT